MGLISQSESDRLASVSSKWSASLQTAISIIGMRKDIEDRINAAGEERLQDLIRWLMAKGIAEVYSLSVPQYTWAYGNPLTPSSD